MKRYRCVVRREIRYEIFVDAESPGAAEEEAIEQVEDDCIISGCTYPQEATVVGVVEWNYGSQSG